MDITNLLIIVCIILLIVNIILTFLKKNSSTTDYLNNELMKTSLNVAKIDPLIRGEFATNRDEIQKSAKDSRQELSNSLKSFEETFSHNVKDSMRWTNFALHFSA